MVREQPLDQFAQQPVRLRTVETFGFRPAAVGNHRRETAYPVTPGDAHVFVGIDFGQQKFALVFMNQFFQPVRQHAARRSPLGANIKQHRRFMRALQHFQIEGRFFYVVRIARAGTHK